MKSYSIRNMSPPDVLWPQLRTMRADVVETWWNCSPDIPEFIFWRMRRGSPARKARTTWKPKSQRVCKEIITVTPIRIRTNQAQTKSKAIALSAELSQVRFWGTQSRLGVHLYLACSLHLQVTTVASLAPTRFVSLLTSGFIGEKEEHLPETSLVNPLETPMLKLQMLVNLLLVIFFVVLIITRHHAGDKRCY